MWLLIAFVAVPLIEIALFIQVGGVIGLWPTLTLVVLTALLGTWLLRLQGTLALAELRRSLSEIEDPSEPLAHGAMILFAGALLLTPGFFTDLVGFALLSPPVRRWIFVRIRERIRIAAAESPPGQTPGGRNGPGARGDPGNRSASGGPPDIIEGEFEDLDERRGHRHERSGPGNGKRHGNGTGSTRH